MSLTRMAIRNTGRHPGRTWLTILAISIAVTAVTFLDAYLRGVVENVFESFIRLDAGHVKIQPVDAKDSSRPLPVDQSMENISDLLAAIDSLPMVEAAAPRIKFLVLLEKKGGSIPALGIGFKPSREMKMMRIHELLIEGEYPADSSNHILLSSGLAASLKKGVGDELFMVTKDIYGGLGPGLFMISGIVESGIGIYDKNIFYAPLAAVNEMLALEDGALEITCRIENGIETPELAVDAINSVLALHGREKISAVSWKDQGHVYAMFSMMGLVNAIMMLLVAVIALTTIVNTILMSVMERVREFGALRALGFQQRMITRIVVTETLVLGLLGTMAGIALGMGISLLLRKTGIDYSNALGGVDVPFNPIIYPHPVVTTALKSGVFGILVSIAASWYPAKKAVRVQPADALRSF